jgi:MFS family permease
MASCMLGSTAFGNLQAKGVKVESMMQTLLVVATMAMAAATFVGANSLAILVAAFFAFEMCVGMYFPSIGTLRSKYIPDSHRSVIMNIFGVPLNLIVVSVFLSIRHLGVQGALACATAALGISALCMTVLKYTSKEEKAFITASA